MKRLAALIVLVGIVSPCFASAQEPDATILNRSAFTETELADLKDGLEHVPRAIRDAVGPIAFRRISKPCLFGMGRYSEVCPTWDEDENFLLYDIPPLQGEGPVWRLEPLERSERASVQRRRAVVHAYLSKWDSQVDWSEHHDWRAINGWTLKTDPQNVYRWGYSRFMGQRSPHLDFVTFAEEFFVRPEAVVAPERRDVLDPDYMVGCQEFTKSRFVTRQLTALDPAWTGDEAWFDGCPEFEKWARTSQVESVDILLAAATADRPESLYGHLLLHIRYRGASDGFEPVYQFGAVTDTNVGFIEYFTRGLLGGFLSVVEISDFRSIDRRILQAEQRTLRHYTLNLDRRQIRHLQERLWEATRRVRYPYFFLDDNCASFLYDLIEPSLGIHLPGRGSFIVTPTDVLDRLANTDNNGRGPLLSKSSEVHFSSRARAQEGVRLRRKAIAALADILGDQQLEETADQLDDADVERRGVIYDRLFVDISDALETAQNPEKAHLHAVDFFLYSSRVERFVVEVEKAKTRAARMRTIDQPSMTAQAQVDKRETLFMFEDLERRARIVSQWTREADELLEAQSMDEWSPAATAQYADEKAAQATYRATLAALGGMIDRWEPDLDAVAYLEAKETAFRQAEARRDALAVGPSGKHRVVVGGGAFATRGATSGLARLNYAFIAEYLGEQRRRGLRPDIESQVFDLRLTVPTTETFYEDIEAELTLFGFKTIEQPLDPVRQSWDDMFGWGFDGKIRHDGMRRLWTELSLGGGYLYPAWRRDRSSTHLVLGIYPEARGLFVPAGPQGHVGARIFARARLHTGGSYANALTAELSTGQAFQFPLWDWAWRSHARIAWDIGLDSSDDPWVIRPFALGSVTNETFELGQEGDIFWRVRGGLEIEL